MSREQIEIMGPYLVLEALDAAGPETLRAVTVDEESAQLVVLRRLPAWMHSRDGYERRVFAEEIARRERSVHRSIARVLDAGELHRVPYLVLEHIPGLSLADVLSALAEEQELMPIACVLDVMLSVVDALLLLTSTGLDHHESRGVSPWLTPRRVLLPFLERPPLFLGVCGSSKALSRRLPPERVIMAMQHEAPELRLGGAPGTSSDAFALGVVLFTMLEGKSPFPIHLGELRRVIDKSVSPAFERCTSRRLRPLRTLIKACLALSVSERPSLWELHETTRTLLLELADDYEGLNVWMKRRFAREHAREDDTKARGLAWAERRLSRATQPPAAREVSVVIALPRVESGRIFTSVDEREVVEVPAGRCLLGPSLEERELPGFFIDRFPVTNRQLLTFLRESGHADALRWRALSDEQLDCPAVNVSHEVASDYARWAGKRLPSEEEWEKAARGPEGWLWPHGRTFDPARMNDQWAQPLEERRAQPIGRFTPQGDSPYGVSDIGMLWEWTSTPSELFDGFIVRGGTWRNRVEPPMNTNRSFEDDGAADVTFRCAVTPEELERVRRR